MPYVSAPSDMARDHARKRLAALATPPGAMVRTFLAGKAGVSALSAAHGVAVRVLDLEVDEEIAAGAQLLISRGTGIDDEAMAHNSAVIDAALARAGSRTSDPTETLTALGSADLAATTG